jgi:hypothetical protein
MNHTETVVELPISGVAFDGHNGFLGLLPA